MADKGAQAPADAAGAAAAAAAGGAAADKGAAAAAGGEKGAAAAEKGGAADDKGAGGKGADDKGGADKGGTDDKGGKAAASKAPEKYALTIPDDAKDAIGKEDLEYLEQVARASEWSNEDAQAELEAAIDRQKAHVKRRIEGWAAQLKADEDFGGEALPETTRLANAAIDKVFPEGHRLREGFLDFMKRSGGDQTLYFAAFAATVGRMMGEDRPVRGRPPAGKPPADADKFYDAPSSKKVHEDSLRAT